MHNIYLIKYKLLFQLQAVYGQRDDEDQWTENEWNPKAVTPHYNLVHNTAKSKMTTLFFLNMIR